MPLAPSIPTPRRIVVRGVNWLGDAVMTTPALKRLRERFPQARIALLTHEKIAELWRDQQFIDEVLTFAPGENPLRIGRRLRAGAFDTALVLPNSPRSALEVWTAGIPRRIGFGARWRRWFLTEVVPPRSGVASMRKRSAREIKLLVTTPIAPPGTDGTAGSSGYRHQVYHYLQLAAALGATAEPAPSPALTVNAGEVAAARARWLDPTKDVTPGTSHTLVGLNPSAAYGPAKRWPVEHFAGVVNQVSEKARVVWLIFGGREDQELCEHLRGLIRAPVVNLAGKTSLRELMSLLTLCRVLLTNDSGPMHLAAALGTPVVVPFGSTSPELTGPGLPGESRHKVLRSNAVCSPCFRRTCPIDLRCLRGIGVTQVAEAVLAVLERDAVI